MKNDSDLKLTLLDASSPDEPFPPLDMAWEEPNGLLALGGDLSPQRLVNAYRNGIFPWYNPDEPILWWSPSPRAVIYPNSIHYSRSLRRTIKKNLYTISFDQDFNGVIDACAAPRSYSNETWISSEMKEAYLKLHRLDYAHSIEVWNSNSELVGGLYGVASGGIFSGESMFSCEPNTSKIAMINLAWHLDHWGYSLMDCQIMNDHLISMGAIEINRKAYQHNLSHIKQPKQHDWKFNLSSDLANWHPKLDHIKVNIK